MKRTVELPPRSIQSRACATAARTSFTPLEVAERTSKRVRTASARSRASVVLPDAGRSPEHHRDEPASLDHATQRAALADQRLLAHELGEVAWSHAGGQRRVDGLAPAAAAVSGVRRRVRPVGLSIPASLVRAMRVTTTI